MAEVTDVTITSGVPTAGTGTVPTLSKTNTVIGAVDETAPASDTASSGLNGRLQRIAQRLSTLITALPQVFGAGTAAAAQRTTLASDDPAVATLGSTSAAKVITDANGTIQQYLRGLVSQWIAGTLVLGTGANVIGKVGIDQTTPGTTNLVQITGTQVASVLDCATTITRPADTNAYTANDAFANSTSAPTAGGFTFTSAAAVSGGGGIITDAVIVASAATLYQGEIWIFDSATAAVPNDNAAFACSDADCLLLLGKIPFTLVADVSTTSLACISGLNIGYHCVGTANLRFLVRITNAPTPGNAETLTIRIKGIRS